MGHLRLTRKRDLSAFRKMALGTWRTSHDPTVRGALTLRMGEALRYLDAFRAATGRRLTINHLMAKAVGQALAAHPDANAILRLGGIYLRHEIAVFFQVALEDPSTGEVDLSGATIRDPHRLSLVEIADRLERSIGEVRGRTDAKERSRSLLRRVPGFAMGTVLGGIGALSYGLNLDLRWLGVPRDPFGSIMITNIGSLGLDEAYPPLVPYARVPLIVALGAVRDRPVVDEAGAVVVRPTMKVCATFDHRLLDGVHAARLVADVRAAIERPFEHFDAL